MKKLILAVAILAGGVSSFALPINMLSNETITVVSNEEFKEVALDQLPEAVIKAVKKDFSTATLTKAYVNESEQYKLVLTIDGNENNVFANKDGKWINETEIANK